MSLGSGRPCTELSTLLTTEKAMQEVQRAYREREVEGRGRSQGLGGR